jgi:quercetin dioxygenase-like cupin family protein
MNVSRNCLASFTLVVALLMVVFQIVSIPQTRAGQLENPYQQLVPGLLTRTLFIAPSGIGFQVEVRDFLVGPRQTTSLVSLPGAAIFEVRSGSGIVSLAGDSQEVQPGSTFALSEGGEFAIKNEADVPLTIRAHLFMAETP